MTRHFTLLVVGASICQWLLTSTLPARAASSEPARIISPHDASWMERLAAREVRRYVYLRTGERLAIVSETDGLQGRGEAILVSRKGREALKGIGAEPYPVRDAHNAPGRAAPVNPGAPESLAAALDRLAPQSYYLKTLAPPPSTRAGGALLLIVGGDDAGTLYAAYRFAERLGVRFYLHGDVIPDEREPWKMPILDERSSPLFELRGIQPFHDFPEGPDWWNRDDYLAIIGQLPKLRMNFLGLHTYPEDRPNAEPTVWIGLPGDVGEGGKVAFSYPSSYQNSLRGNWGYLPTKTGDYLFGSAALFERDAFGPEVMGTWIPAPTTDEADTEVFDRTTAMLREAFGFARKLGVKTCVGTETPLIVPKRVQDRIKALGRSPADAAVTQQLYEGIFKRAAQAYPLDYYWFWTPEGWTWSGVKEEQIAETTQDFAAAIAAYKKVGPPFGLATCGWVLGPQQDRAMFDRLLPKEMAVSCINREVGYSPVEAGFADVKGRSKWAIPWLEDDPALTSPQLWVGRMRRDAADAMRYDCDGLMGIHWRTRVLGPNISALAQAAWDQSPWLASYKPVLPPARQLRVAGAEGGAVASFPDNPIADTTDAPLYQTVRYNLSAYHLPATNGVCKVTLKFCEPHYDAAGKRAFDVKLQGRMVITNLDIFARVGKNRALDYNFEDVAVTNGWLDIEFVPRIEFPSIAALAVEGNGFATRINCGGPAYKDYAADVAAPTPQPVLPSTKDFYEDWALHQFGPGAAAAASIFQRIDGNLPKPSTWTDGPGGIRPDARPWEQAQKEYAFVEEFAALRPQVQGAGNLERFDYWLSTFRYFRAIGEMNCAWAEYDRLFEKLKQEKDPAARKLSARQEAIPARRRLIRLVGAIFENLLATVSTPGELGTVANWNQHNLPGLLLKPGEELARMLGEPLPAEAQPGMRYEGPMRIIVPALRTSLPANEPLKLKVIILSEHPPRQAALHWRKLGEGAFAQVPLQHLERGVYSVTLPAVGDDFEYFLQAEPEPGQGEPARFPATAPKLNQTVVAEQRGN
ncbi:MAG: malectin domain-containing carbohydrate-binding protein [Limisphaerales bacterium]